MSSKKNTLINIRGSKEINDPYYRYTMEAVMLCNQGAKIAFLNIDTICQSLSREPKQLLQFLKKYFGSGFDYKNNTAYTTKKDLSNDSLQNAIYEFIEDQILCKQCGNPETELLEVKKNSFLICKACSFKREV